MLRILFCNIVAKLQIDDGYPTLMFFMAGGNTSVVHRGPQDLDTLMAFVYDQIGRKPIEVKVLK